MGALASACRERALISGTDKGGAEAAPWYKAEAPGGAKGENSSSSSSGNVSGADTLMGCGGRSSLACRASAGGVYGDDVVDEGVDRITVDVRMVSSRCLSISVRAAASSSASDMGRRRCMCTRSTSCSAMHASSSSPSRIRSNCANKAFSASMYSFLSSWRPNSECR